jgi:hypothetical protein
MTGGMFLIHSMLLHSRDAREIGIEPGGHATAPSPHHVGPSHRAIDSEVLPSVGNFIVVELNDDGALIARHGVDKATRVFH